ncbi:MAG: hypothetical protein A6F71_03975 [Cycloclasticus sp. symbiont of Poecilosclerida sp. M]|nr:MAG: hypothetical protein A6F71_03975 [Cycloclasticus sp. symbiont of Poecilosclerida sp. M]
MIIEVATVQALNGDLAKVVITKQSACHQCDESNTCGTSFLSNFFASKEIELNLKTNLPLVEGDTVNVGLDENTLLRLTFTMYLLPLLGLIVFAFIGRVIETYFQLSHELLTVSFALVGFSGSLFVLRFYKKVWLHPEKLNPIILKKV